MVMSFAKWQCFMQPFATLYKKDVLSQGEPFDAAVNFDTYRIFQRHCAVSLSQRSFLVYISDRSKC